MEICVILYNTTKSRALPIYHISECLRDSGFSVIIVDIFVQCTFSKVSKRVYNLMSSADKELPQ